jgi:rubrerythrin
MQNDATEKMAIGLKIAMQAEQEGHHFYLMAARTTEDAKGREVFEQLAEDERHHFEFLKTNYQSMLRSGTADKKMKLKPKTSYTGESPIFSEAIRARIGDAHFEMTSLSVGIQLELNAVNYYNKAAEEASDPGVKAFYKELADWESGHYNALLAQQDALKQDYWEKNTFQPF